MFVEKEQKEKEDFTFSYFYELFPDLRKYKNKTRRSVANHMYLQYSAAMSFMGEMMSLKESVLQMKSIF
jgi:hypothetical protein